MFLPSLDKIIYLLSEDQVVIDLSGTVDVEYCFSGAAFIKVNDFVVVLPREILMLLSDAELPTLSVYKNVGTELCVFCGDIHLSPLDVHMLLGASVYAP